MKDKLFNIVTIALLAAVLLVVTTQKQGTITVTGPEGVRTNTITTTGTSDLSVDPDEAIVYLSIVTEGVTAKEAQQKNNVATNKVKESLKSNKIKEDKIETEVYYLNKKEHWDPTTGKSIVDGYTQTHNMKVTIKDLDNLGEVIDDAVKAGVNNINNVMFDLSKEKKKEVNAEALEIASLEAKGKAENLAKSLGVRLGKLVSVSEANYVITPYYAGVAGRADLMVAESPKADLSPKKVSVNLNVNLVYEIA